MVLLVYILPCLYYVLFTIFVLFFYLQSLLNFGDNFVKSDENILDVLPPGHRDKLQVVVPVDPEEKVVIVVDVNSSPRLEAINSGVSVSSQSEDISLEKFLQLEWGEILQAVILS